MRMENPLDGEARPIRRRVHNSLTGLVAVLLVMLLSAAVAIAGEPPRWATNGVPAAHGPSRRMSGSPRCIVPDGLGGAVLGYVYSAPGAAGKVWAQRIDGGGHPMWGAAGVPLSGAATTQDWPAAIPDGRGGAIIAWIDGGVAVQRVDSAGSLLWGPSGIRISDATSDSNPRQFLISDGADGAVVLWSMSNGSQVTCAAQRLSADGTLLWGSGVVVCDFPSLKSSAVIAPDGTGGAIVAWDDSRNLHVTGHDIFAQRVDGSGQRRWPSEGREVTVRNRDEYSPLIAEDGAGGAVVGWFDVIGTGQPEHDAARLDANGNLLWYKRIALSTSINTDFAPDGAGGLLLSWSPSTPGVIGAQRVGPDGTVRWGESGARVCGGTASSGRLCADGAGGALVAWYDTRLGASDPQVYCQHVAPDGGLRWGANGLPVCTTAGVQESAGIARVGSAAAVVAWTDYRAGVESVYAQKVRGVGPAPARYRVSATDSIGVTQPSTTWYLAEGSSFGGFETWILVQNPGDEAAPVTLTYMTDAGEVAGPQVNLMPRSRVSFYVGDTVRMWQVSTRVTAGKPVIAERAVYFNNKEAATDSIGVSQPAQTWYLAEGCSEGGFETWVLVQNPGDEPAGVALTYMTPGGSVPGPSLVLAAHSRMSFFVADAVRSWEVSTKVDSTRPVIAERAVYFNNRKAATVSIGVTEAKDTWYLAEGSSEGGFETWVLVQNPGDQAAPVSLTYMTDSGQVQGPSFNLPPGSRKSFFVADTVRSWEVSTRVASTVPVIAERAVYFDNRGAATDSVGTEVPRNDWYLAEGSTFGGFETWVLVQNPGDIPGAVTLTYQTDRGEVTGPTLSLPARSRLSVDVADTVEAWQVSTRVSATVPVVVERAMYYST